jgi:hypothetical protein
MRALATFCCHLLMSHRTLKWRETSIIHLTRFLYSRLPLPFSRNESTYVMQADILLCVEGCRYSALHCVRVSLAIIRNLRWHDTSLVFCSLVKPVYEMEMLPKYWACHVYGFILCLVCLSLHLLTCFFLFSRFISLCLLHVLSFSLIPSLLFTHAFVLPTCLSLCPVKINRRFRGTCPVSLQEF